MPFLFLLRLWVPLGEMYRQSVTWEIAERGWLMCVWGRGTLLRVGGYFFWNLNGQPVPTEAGSNVRSAMKWPPAHSVASSSVGMLYFHSRPRLPFFNYEMLILLQNSRPSKLTRRTRRANWMLIRIEVIYNVNKLDSLAKLSFSVFHYLR